MRAALWYLVWLVVRAYAATRPQATIYVSGAPYMTRWFLTSRPSPGETGEPGYYLQHFHAADVDRRLHSHPWEGASSRILRGGYTELRAYGDRAPWVHEYRAGDTSRITPGTWHRVAALHGETWTLFRAGPKHGRGWGFR